MCHFQTYCFVMTSHILFFLIEKGSLDSSAAPSKSFPSLVSASIHSCLWGGRCKQPLWGLKHIVSKLNLWLKFRLKITRLDVTQVCDLLKLWLKIWLNILFLTCIWHRYILVSIKTSKYVCSDMYLCAKKELHWVSNVHLLSPFWFVSPLRRFSSTIVKFSLN